MLAHAAARLEHWPDDGSQVARIEAQLLRRDLLDGGLVSELIDCLAVIGINPSDGGKNRSDLVCELRPAQDLRRSLDVRYVRDDCGDPAVGGDETDRRGDVLRNAFPDKPQSLVLRPSSRGR